MRIPYNNVLVKMDRDNDELLLSNGDKLKLVTAWEPYMHAVTSGIVLAVPEKLIFDPINHNTLMFKVPMELQVGDRVIFDYKAEAQVKKEYEPIEGGYPIRYDAIHLAIRGEEIIPVNGYVILEACESTEDEQIKNIIKAGLDLTQEIMSTKSKQFGIVRYLGSPVLQYAQLDVELGEENDILEVGQKVHFDSNYAVPLQYDLHQIIDKGKTLYRVRRKNINYVVDSN